MTSPERRAVAAIQQEYERACQLWPDWPDDVVYAAAILLEEAGETLKEALNLWHGKAVSVEKLREEATQTGAMALRLLVELEHGDG